VLHVCNKNVTSLTSSQPFTEFSRVTPLARVLKVRQRSIQLCSVGRTTLCCASRLLLKCVAGRSARGLGNITAGMLQECYKSATRVLQECYKSVTRVVPLKAHSMVAMNRPQSGSGVISVHCKGDRGVTGMLQVSYEGVTRVLRYKGVTRVLQGCYKMVTRVLHLCYKCVTKVLQVCYERVTTGLRQV
jgi:hypothetical protein